MALLTVITVVKDDDDGFSRTVRSMAPQDLADVEWVVIDSSTDHDSVPAILAEQDSTAHVTWVAPAGVYPAMNVGLDLATGEYAYFLNAGDQLAAHDVLAEVTRRLRERRPVWAYGRVQFLAEDGTPAAEPPWDYRAEQRRSFARGRFPAHQAVVLSVGELRRQGGFDTTYRVAADYASILKATAVADPDIWDLHIADFTVGGLSSTQWRTAQSEFHRARCEVLRPRGTSAILEGFDTARGRVSTALYRGLWAPGRPFHDAVSRARGQSPTPR